MRRQPRQQRPFSLRYVPLATDGGPDQVLTIENHTDVSVIPTLTFTPLDVYGRELPHVVTQTVHGSHLGGPLLPAGGSLPTSSASTVSATARSGAFVSSWPPPRSSTTRRSSRTPAAS